MADIEKLHFKIELAGTYWEKIPQYSVAINNDLIVPSGIISTESDESFFVEFDYDADEEKDYEIQIRLENKTDLDVLKDDYESEKFIILKDMLLHIRSIEIDDIELGFLMLSHSEFIGDDPERPTLHQCVDLGWNGTWKFMFKSPFYIWLLENV